MQKLEKSRTVKWKRVVLFSIAFSVIASSAFVLPRASASTYGDNFLVDGTCSAKTSYVSAPCDLAFDGNTATRWNSDEANNFPQWIKYDLGSGISKRADKLSIYKQGTSQFKDFTLSGSNDDSNWSVLIATTSIDSEGWFDWYATSTESFRYFKLDLPNRWGGYTNYMEIYEMQAFECLDCGGSSTTTATSSIEQLKNQAQTNLFIQLFYLIDALFFGFVLWVCWKGIKKLFKLK